MNIDVPTGMCQGVHLHRDKANYCRNKYKFIINNKFYVCELHKNQKFCN